MNKVIVSRTDGEIYSAVIEDYKDYYKHLEASMFDIVYVDWMGVKVSLMVDDEGLLKSGNLGRKAEGYPNPLFGHIVVLGLADEEGVTLDLDERCNEEMVMVMISTCQWRVT